MHKKKRIIISACVVAALLAFICPVVFAQQTVSPDNYIYDVNSDGKISLSDLLVVASNVGKSVGDTDYVRAYDCDRDGKITASDARMMAAALIGKYDLPDVESISEYASPCSITADVNSNDLYCVENTSGKILRMDSVTGKAVELLDVGAKPNGVAISPDSSCLYITYDGAESGVRTLTRNAQGDAVLSDLIVTGHTPMSPVLSADGKTLYVVNRFSGTLSAIDTETMAVLQTVKAGREPISLAVGPQGKLYVANHAADQASTASYVGAGVRVFDGKTLALIKNISLCDGATGVRQLTVAADGYVYVTHLLAHYWITTTQLDKGWMNSNVVSIVDGNTDTYLTTVQLDDMTQGAANPWGITVTGDGKYLAVTSAGTHQLILIDRIGMHQKIKDVQDGNLPRRDSDGDVISTDLSIANGMPDIPYAIGFIDEYKERIQLSGNGPRGVVCKNDRLFIAAYFSDTIEIVNLQNTSMPVEQLGLSQKPISENEIRLGEMRFNDAGICFENWQSCASCHPDARADSVNWDNLNDGVGNPKNTKSMLYTHYTSPVMVTGIRANAEKAVRAGMKYIQFYGGSDSEEIAGEIDTYLKSLKAETSPYLVKGVLTEAAQQGKTLFDARCASCHSTADGMYTQDGKVHTVSHIPENEIDLVTQPSIAGIQRGKLNTPSLNECWRTAPYLYDGRAATIEDVIRIHYGSNLSDEDISRLAEYVLTL